ncbi:hypothetical protein PBAL39_13922, partial [Pedobacter sp. BAL39]
MDNEQKIGSLESGNINVNENYEVEFWAKKFNVSPQRLREIIKVTGT